MRKGLLLVSMISGLIAIAVQPLTLAAATPSLTGSWQFTLTPTTQPTPPVVQIPGLATFTADGSVIETDGTEFVPNPVSVTPLASGGTPGHGIWQVGPAASLLYVQYISLVLQANGALHAKNVTTMFLSLNAKGDQFTGTYTTNQVIGAITKVVSTGTVSGQLIPHPPLP